MTMTKQEIIDAIIDSARKTTQWPKGHRNYDAIDLINLERWVKKYDEI